MFTEIVVAFDGSEHSETALKAACDLADKYAANLHVVHVPELYDQAVAMGASAVIVPVSEDALQESGETMIERANDLAHKAGKTLTSTGILAAPAADAILSFADDKNADLIVSGRRGLGNLKGLLMGSVSQHLASTAECAVLTVK